MGNLSFKRYGGKHWESSAMRHLLAHAGIRNPFTGKPLSEALCFGIAGGIAAGYSFCPSIIKHGVGSGVSAVGRYRVFTTDGSYYTDFFKRLGIAIQVKESKSIKTAHTHLTQALDQYRPALVWCTPMRVAPHLWQGTCGMYTTIVTDINDKSGTATLSDCSKKPIILSIEDLQWARNRVCSLKNRSLTVEPKIKPLTKTLLKQAVRAGLNACLADFERPKLKSFHLPGLKEWANFINNPKHKKGWPTIFQQPGLLYLGLRDIYNSIETASTGGSFFRPLYAAFLKEASVILNQKELGQSAQAYIKLGNQWSSFANALLPDAVDSFKKTKHLLHTEETYFLNEGMSSNCQKTHDELTLLEKKMTQTFPLSAEKQVSLLHSLSEYLHQLHDLEFDSAKQLKEIAINS